MSVLKSFFHWELSLSIFESVRERDRARVRTESSKGPFERCIYIYAHGIGFWGLLLNVVVYTVQSRFIPTTWWIVCTSWNRSCRCYQHALTWEITVYSTWFGLTYISNNLYSVYSFCSCVFLLLIWFDSFLLLFLFIFYILTLVVDGYLELLSFYFVGPMRLCHIRLWDDVVLCATQRNQ